MALLFFNYFAIFLKTTFEFCHFNTGDAMCVHTVYQQAKIKPYVPYQDLFLYQINVYYTSKVELTHNRPQSIFTHGLTHFLIIITK